MIEGERRKEDWRLRLADRMAERLDVAVRASGVGIFEWDVRSSRLSGDARMLKLYGLPKDDGMGLGAFLRRIHPDDRQRVAGEMEQAAAGRRALDSDFRIEVRGGERWMRATADLICDAAGQPVRLLGACWDITDSRGVEDKLHEGREQLEITLASIGDAVVTSDARGRVTFINAAAEALTGLRVQDAWRLPVSQVLDFRALEDDEPICDFVEGVVRGGLARARLEAGLASRHGEACEVEAWASCIRTRRGDIVGAVTVIRDVTEAKRHERALRHAATHDALTGLANRLRLEEVLAEAVEANRAHGARCVLGYLDIDQFKLINDSAGHGAGDQFLRQIAGVFASLMKPGDLLARIGGDEFALVLFDEDLEEAAALAEGLLKGAAGFHFLWQGQVFSAGASIGLSAVEAGTPVAELLSQADVACYTAKSLGRGRVAVYRPDDSEVARRRQEISLVAGMCQVLSEGRLTLFAQEIVPACGPGAGRHFELLTRMTGRDGEPISPGVFIPAAERFDMMADFDRWVVGEALHRLGPRIAAAPGLSLSINLSGNSFNSAELLEWILQSIAASPVDAGALTFEVTETALLNHMAAAGAFMERLRRAGCRVALDDFGAGLSSFGYLKQFPVDGVKIDGSFVRNIESSEVDRAIVESMNALAHRLGARTVAEFVESQGAIEVLRSIGVDYLQGYAIGRPQSFEGLLDALAPAQPAGLAQLSDR